MNNLIYTKRIVIYMAMFTAQQALPNIPYVYKGIYFIVVCASVLLLFVYWPDIRHSWRKFQIVIKKKGITKTQDKKFRPGENSLEMVSDLKYTRAELTIYVPLVMNA